MSRKQTVGRLWIFNRRISQTLLGGIHYVITIRLSFWRVEGKRGMRRNCGRREETLAFRPLPMMQEVGGGKLAIDIEQVPVTLFAPPRA